MNGIYHCDQSEERRLEVVSESIEVAGINRATGVNINRADTGRELAGWEGSWAGGQPVGPEE